MNEEELWRKKGLLAWNCGDEVLRRLKRAKSEKRRQLISDEVLMALQHHSTTDDIDHVILYMEDGMVVVDFQLPDCQRRIDLRRIMEEEVEARGGRDDEVALMEKLFDDLARLCREARLENRPAAGEPVEPLAQLGER